MFLKLCVYVYILLQDGPDISVRAGFGLTRGPERAHATIPSEVDHVG